MAIRHACQDDGYVAVPSTGWQVTDCPASFPLAARNRPGPLICIGAEPFVISTLTTKVPPSRDAGARPATTTLDPTCFGAAIGGLTVVTESRSRPRLCSGGEPCFNVNFSVVPPAKPIGCCVWKIAACGRPSQGLIDQPVWRLPSMTAATSKPS